MFFWSILAFLQKNELVLNSRKLQKCNWGTKMQKKNKEKVKNWISRQDIYRSTVLCATGAVNSPLWASLPVSSCNFEKTSKCKKKIHTFHFTLENNQQKHKREFRCSKAIQTDMYWLSSCVCDNLKQITKKATITGWKELEVFIWWQQ